MQGSDPFSPTALGPQRTVPLEDWEEEQGARAAPDDLLTSYPGTGREERPARPRPHLPGRLLGRLTDPGRPRTLGFSASGPRIGAWMVSPPARRGLRTAAPGSCAERRFQDRRRLISEARAHNHIPPRPSCSVCLHHQPAKLIPAARAHRWSGAGVIPAARIRLCEHSGAPTAPHMSSSGLLALGPVPGVPRTQPFANARAS